MLLNSTMLAVALDIDQSTLSKIENCKRNVPEEILLSLSDFFNIDLKLLEKELNSEKIANILYKENDTKELIKLAEEKASYFRTKKLQQGIINF
ncbi:MAG: helix-turn-helix domain-containing protein [Ignavibacteriaceae bacterium]